MCQILIIDDDSHQRTSLRLGLEALGHEVRTAENGAVAVRMLREQGPAPTLVVTDMVMPEMDGLEVIRHLRQHAPEIPVVAMSGELPESILQLARRLGARAAFAKPVRADRIQAALDEILSATA